jgi:hypothetical protein
MDSSFQKLILNRNRPEGPIREMHNSEFIVPNVVTLQISYCTVQKYFMRYLVKLPI